MQVKPGNFQPIVTNGGWGIRPEYFNCEYHVQNTQGGKVIIANASPLEMAQLNADAFVVSNLRVPPAKAHLVPKLEIPEEVSPPLHDALKRLREKILSTTHRGWGRECSIKSVRFGTGQHLFGIHGEGRGRMNSSRTAYLVSPEEIEQAYTSALSCAIMSHAISSMVFLYPAGAIAGIGAIDAARAFIKALKEVYIKDITIGIGVPHLGDDTQAYFDFVLGFMAGCQKGPTVSLKGHRGKWLLALEQDDSKRPTMSDINNFIQECHIVNPPPEEIARLIIQNLKLYSARHYSRLDTTDQLTALWKLCSEKIADHNLKNKVYAKIIECSTKLRHGAFMRVYIKIFGKDYLHSNQMIRNAYLMDRMRYSAEQWIESKCLKEEYYEDALTCVSIMNNPYAFTVLASFFVEIGWDRDKSPWCQKGQEFDRAEGLLIRARSLMKKMQLDDDTRAFYSFAIAKVYVDLYKFDKANEILLDLVKTTKRIMNIKPEEEPGKTPIRALPGPDGSLESEIDAAFDRIDKINAKPDPIGYSKTIAQMVNDMIDQLDELANIRGNDFIERADPEKIEDLKIMLTSMCSGAQKIVLNAAAKGDIPLELAVTIATPTLLAMGRIDDEAKELAQERLETLLSQIQIGPENNSPKRIPGWTTLNPGGPFAEPGKQLVGIPEPSNNQNGIDADPDPALVAEPPIKLLGDGSSD